MLQLRVLVSWSSARPPLPPFPLYCPLWMASADCPTAVMASGGRGRESPMSEDEAYAGPSKTKAELDKIRTNENARVAADQEDRVNKRLAFIQRQTDLLLHFDPKVRSASVAAPPVRPCSWRSRERNFVAACNVSTGCGRVYDWWLSRCNGVWIDLQCHLEVMLLSVDARLCRKTDVSTESAGQAGISWRGVH